MNGLVLILGVALGAIVGALIVSLARSGGRKEQDEARTQIRETVKAAAADALHENQSVFLDLARTSFEGLQKDAQAQLLARQAAIDTLVRPMTDTLKKVETRLHEAEKDRV